MPYAISPAPVWKPWVRSPVWVSVWVSAGNMLMIRRSGILAITWRTMQCIFLDGTGLLRRHASQMRKVRPLTLTIKSEIRFTVPFIPAIIPTG